MLCSVEQLSNRHDSESERKARREIRSEQIQRVRRLEAQLIGVFFVFFLFVCLFFVCLLLLFVCWLVFCLFVVVFVLFFGCCCFFFFGGGGGGGVISVCPSSIP